MVKKPCCFIKGIKVKKLLILVLLLSGCSSLQPSTYTNYNTPYGNVIRATGVSANNAGLANTSYNCPSCALSGGSGGGSGGYTNYNSQMNGMNKITYDAVRSLSFSISDKINESIRDSF